MRALAGFRPAWNPTPVTDLRSKPHGAQQMLFPGHADFCASFQTWVRPVMADAPGRLTALQLPPPDPETPLFLIVEDNRYNRRLLRDIMRIQGWRTVEVERMDEARHVLRMLRVRGERPAALMLDMRLPDGDGLQLVGELRADRHWRDLPVIAVSALAMAGDRDRIVQGGCDAYVAKPFSVPDLLEIVQKTVPSGTLSHGLV